MTSSSELHALAPNRSIPPCAIIPVLGYPDVAEAVEWLREAFGFAERLRIGDHRAQLMLGGGAIVVAAREHYRDERGESHSVMVRVTDIDFHCAHAEHRGARILSRPTDYPYGERQYSAEDFAGHRWTFTQTIADVHPAEWGGILL